MCHLAEPRRLGTEIVGARLACKWLEANGWPGQVKSKRKREVGKSGKRVDADAGDV